MRMPEKSSSDDLDVDPARLANRRGYAQYSEIEQMARPGRPDAQVDEPACTARFSRRHRLRAPACTRSGCGYGAKQMRVWSKAEDVRRPPGERMVPLNGLEPLTPSLRMMCSTS